MRTELDAVLGKVQAQNKKVLRTKKWCVKSVCSESGQFFSFESVKGKNILACTSKQGGSKKGVLPSGEKGQSANNIK